MKWLDAIEERLQAATPGPHQVDGTSPTWDGEEYALSWVETSREKWIPSGSLNTADDMCQQRADADLFAHAPTDLRRLVAFVREQDAALGQMREAVKVATEALEFYGEKSNWVSRSGKMGVCPIDTEDRETLDHDSYKQEYPWAGGKKAREALAALEKLGDGK